MSAPDEPAFRLFRMDAVEWLASLADGVLDLVVTDPPYESLEKHRKVGTTTRLSRSKASSNDWFEVFPNHRFEEFFRQCHRVLKNNSHLYMFCDAETMFVVKPLAEAAGFRFWKPLIWDKVHIGMGYHYRARYEVILFFEKGKRKLADLSVPDILEFTRVRDGYPAEKPAPLAEVLVRQSSLAGECVCDPFMGSGSVGVASVGQGRRFLGNDPCEEAVNIGRRRMKRAGGIDRNFLEELKDSSDTTQLELGF